MSVLISLVFAFALGFAGASEAPTAPVQVQQVQHDPILAMDAAATLEDKGGIAFEADGHYYVAQYVESSPSSDSLFGEFTYESIDFPGTYHHYTYTELVKA